MIFFKTKLTIVVWQLFIAIKSFHCDNGNSQLMAIGGLDLLKYMWIDK